MLFGGNNAQPEAKNNALAQSGRNCASSGCHAEIRAGSRHAPGKPGRRSQCGPGTGIALFHVWQRAAGHRRANNTGQRPPADAQA